MKKEGFTLSSKNINSVFNSLEKKLKNVKNQDGKFLIIPTYYRGKIDREKYKGIGRPRFSDYEMIHYRDFFPKSCFINPPN